MYGIIGTKFNWFSSYLKGRKQFVNFNNETSESCEITCGVPQGYVLGPILFLLFINDIYNSAVEECVLNMYADDVIIYTSAMSTHELECKLQYCIDSILIRIIWISFVFMRRNPVLWWLEASFSYGHWTLTILLSL